MKKIAAVVIVVVLALSTVMLAGCATYECSNCGAQTTEAYYDMGMNKNRVMCADCARRYWSPLPIDGYRV